MDRYLSQILETARTIGTLRTVEMSEASNYIPKRIEIRGITEDGERFALDLFVGEKKKEERDA